MTQDLASEFRSLAIGVRMVPFVLVLILSYMGLHMVSQIGTFELLYSDMLGGKPLPGLTILLIKGKLFFMFLAGAIPLAAIFIQLRVQNHRIALVSLSILILLSFGLTHLLWIGITLPIRLIISGMTGGI